MKTLTMRVTLVLKRAREILAVWLLTIVFGASHRVGAATVQYGYDALYRLKQLTYTDNTTITYSYDAVGNWTTNTVIVSADTDADGIPDWWMNQYFGHPTGQAGDKSRANDDADGDGMTNLQEFFAGTNPLNSASVLRISTVVKQGNDMVFSFPTVTNRFYVLEWKSELTSGVWATVPGFVSGDGSVQQTSHIGGAALPQRFYRLRLLN